MNRNDMRVLAVVGARPQFVKAAEFARACAEAGVQHELLHTGQHYDDALSRAFFDELEIPDPAVNLAVGSGTHAQQTAEMMRHLNRFLDGLTYRPDWVVVFGDTNSTLAAALVVTKRGLRLAHVEAGLRSYQVGMAEEINRVLTDRVADLLFCPTGTAVENLAREGVNEGVYLTGDVMYDSVMRYKDRALEKFALPPGSRPFNLATIHRAENTDDPGRLADALSCLAASDLPVLWPLHPRTRRRLERFGLPLPENVSSVEPVGYLEMLALIQQSRRVITDSGGVQKEAFWLETPCITLRSTTEWPETQEGGWNVLVDVDPTQFEQSLSVTPRPLALSEKEARRGAAARMIECLQSGVAVE